MFIYEHSGKMREEESNTFNQLHSREICRDLVWHHQQRNDQTASSQIRLTIQKHEINWDPHNQAWICWTVNYVVKQQLSPKLSLKGSSNKVRTLIRGPEQLDKKYEYNKTRRKTTCWNCIAACLGSMLVNAFSRASSRRVCIASRPAQCIILSRNQSKKDSLL